MTLLAPLLVSFAAMTVTPDQAIADARRAWATEGGRLWGTNLAGPLLIVDQNTRQVWASEADAESRLKNEGGVYTGVLGAEVATANTAVDWGGKRWSMVVLPLPEDPQLRTALLLHESFHRVQPALHLDASGALNGHLDQLEGRIWLKLEWRALAKALEAKGPARRKWVALALACRTRRQTVFPDAAEAERSLELAEGLAEYTGIHATGARRLVLDKLSQAQGPFARSFAYTSGPAYGLLLDEQSPGWARRVRLATDLSVLLQEAYQLPASAEKEWAAAEVALGGAELRAREVAEEEVRRQALAQAVEPLLHGPVLRVPKGFRLEFNPSNTQVVEGVGIYHPTATVRGEWGVLTVTQGGLRREWSEFVVAAPADCSTIPLSGPGWTLEFAPGWGAKPTEPTGSCRPERLPSR